MSVDEAWSSSATASLHPGAHKILERLHDVGLGYSRSASR